MYISYDVPDWNAGLYRDEGAIRKCARPWKMAHDRPSDTAVLLFHGFAGYPGELIRPARDLFERGFDCYCPRYPGHGTTGLDFSRSTGADWLGCAEAAFRDLSGRYRDVFLVGHSMGGAVAVIVASKFGTKKLALLAPALQLSIPTGKARILRFFARRIKSVWQPDPRYTFYYEGDPDDDTYLGHEYWSYIYPKEVWELEKIRRQALSCIPALKADTLAVSGGEDTMVPQSACELVASKPEGRNRHLHIPHGSHLLPYDKDLRRRIRR